MPSRSPGQPPLPPATAEEGLRALTKRERESPPWWRRVGRAGRAPSACLSEKTVERDLSRIFAKLGVSGRAGLAAVVAADPRQE